MQHRVGDPRLISLIRRWLKAGVLEDGEVHPSEKGTPQGGSISVLLSNVYLHYVLDLWFERVVKPRLRGEAYLVRYIDDFVVCFQYREDALRVQDALCKRLGKFGLTLEPTKTKLVEFGRFAQRHAAQTRQEAPGNDLLSGLHALLHAQPEGQLQGWDAHREVTLAAQSHVIAGPDAANAAPAGPGTGRQSQRRADAVTMPITALPEISAPCKRSTGPSNVTGTRCFAAAAGQGRITWDVFHQIKQRLPILRPKLWLPYRELQALAVL